MVATTTAEAGKVDVIVTDMTVTSPSASVDEDAEVIMEGGGVENEVIDDVVRITGAVVVGEEDVDVEVDVDVDVEVEVDVSLDEEEDDDDDDEELEEELVVHDVLKNVTNDVWTSELVNVNGI